MHWGEPGCQPQRQVRWCALVEPQQGLGGPMLGAEGTETEGGSGQALIPSSATDWLRDCRWTIPALGAQSPQQ